MLSRRQFFRSLGGIGAVSASTAAYGFGEPDRLPAGCLCPRCFAEGSHRTTSSPKRFGFEQPGSFRSRAVGCTQSGLFFLRQVGERFRSFGFLKVQTRIVADGIGLFAKQLDCFQRFVRVACADLYMRRANCVFEILGV